jgi:hypothetical protein
MKLLTNIPNQRYTGSLIHTIFACCKKLCICCLMRDKRQLIYCSLDGTMRQGMKNELKSVSSNQTALKKSFIQYLACADSSTYNVKSYVREICVMQGVSVGTFRALRYYQNLVQLMKFRVRDLKILHAQCYF